MFDRMGWPKSAACLAGLLMIGFGFKERMHVQRMHADGRPALMDSAKAFTVPETANGKKQQPEYSFTTDKGVKVVSTRSFPAEIMPDLVAARLVRVLYDANDPGKMIFASERPSWIMIAAGALIIALAMVFL
ncbi:hypothetical protein [Massilia genomosp. 1]|uniref:DUF3592 domain-containing protein n=1 Tax=Massilia genomosp. 1 TaxID=2609280 RepID=A0ABX0MSV9_9BURK|nr:hypothetical protein [Massilia genomosp. 1]NHZ62512.1 hypothetical protein [Massilia genomosp. 1]